MGTTCSPVKLHHGSVKCRPNLRPGLVVILLLHSFQGARLAVTEEMPSPQIIPPFLSDLHEHYVGVEELFPLSNLSQCSCIDQVSLSLAGQHVWAAGVVDFRQHLKEFNFFLVLSNIVLQVSYQTIGQQDLQHSFEDLVLDSLHLKRSSHGMIQMC